MEFDQSTKCFRFFKFKDEHEKMNLSSTYPFSVKVSEKVINMSKTQDNAVLHYHINPLMERNMRNTLLSKESFLKHYIFVTVFFTWFFTFIFADIC